MLTPAPTRLEYAHALDTAVSWLGSSRGPLLALVSTPEFVDLVAARATGPMILACDNGKTAGHARRVLESGVLPTEVLEGSQVVSEAEPLTAATGFARAIWVTPQPDTLTATLATVTNALDPDAVVCILTATELGGLLQPMRRARQIGDPAPLARTLGARLATAGWHICRSQNFGATTSLGWAIGRRVAEVFQRLDLADRAERAHHTAVESGTVAAYTVVMATRTSEQSGREPHR